jgi:hypothetical protein
VFGCSAPRSAFVCGVGRGCVVCGASMQPATRAQSPKVRRAELSSFPRPGKTQPPTIAHRSATPSRAQGRRGRVRAWVLVVFGERLARTRTASQAGRRAEQTCSDKHGHAHSGTTRRERGTVCGGVCTTACCLLALLASECLSGSVWLVAAWGRRVHTHASVADRGAELIGGCGFWRRADLFGLTERPLARVPHWRWPIRYSPRVPVR